MLQVGHQQCSSGAASKFLLMLLVLIRREGCDVRKCCQEGVVPLDILVAMSLLLWMASPICRDLRTPEGSACFGLPDMG